MIPTTPLLIVLCVASVVSFVVASFKAVVAEDERDGTQRLLSVVWTIGGFAYAILAVILIWP